MREVEPQVLIVGASARGFAESAAIAGYRVATVDAYGDLDLELRAAALSLRRDLGIPYTADAAARAAAAIHCSTVAYVSNFENHPEALRRLGDGRLLLGNPPDVVARVREPVVLADALSRRGFAVPAVRTVRPRATKMPSRTDWLVKPRASGGGHGVRPWREGEPVHRAAYLQQRIDGVAGSISFVANGRRAIPLGLSRQLIGEPAFGASGFRYCGSLLATGATTLFDRQDALRTAAAALAQATTEEFGLIGVNGIDFVARDGIPYPIEVNPRYSASMELIERAYDISIFQLHADACAGRLPELLPSLRRFASPVLGKAIVFAQDEVLMGPVRRWWRDEGVRDVPHPGERIAGGQPICTVLADGRDDAACRAALVDGARAIYTTAAHSARSVA
jgi:predicted ATP-grasp superfamily ATP-dependent carboligase